MGSAEVSVVCKPWNVQDRMEQWVMTRDLENVDPRSREETTAVAVVRI